MKTKEKYLFLDKSHFEGPTFLSRTKTFQQPSPYKARHEVKQNWPFLMSTLPKHGNSLVHSNGFHTVENAAKIYRMPSNRENIAKGEDEIATDFEDIASLNEPAVCVGTSVAKPKPPSALTLKYNSNLVAKSKRTPINVTNRSQRKGSKNEANNQKRVYDSNVLSTKAYNKQDVLSSLKKLNLIEPFLGSKKNGSYPEIWNSSTVQVGPVTVDTSTPFEGLNKDDDCLAFTKSYIETSQPLTPKKKEVRELVLDNQSGKSHPSDDVDNSKANLSCNNTNHTLYVVNGKGDFELKHDYLDTSDNESIVYRDAYSNAISVKEESNIRLRRRYKTPNSIGESLEEQPKPTKRRQSHLTQKQLSFVGSALPTASVVDISTGSVVENDVRSNEIDQLAISDNFQQLRSLAGSKAGVPSSFYHNRSIKRRKKEDQAEMIELSKLKEKARDDIRSLLASSDRSDRESALERARTEAIKLPAKNPVEYKIVRLPSPTQVVVTNDQKSESRADDDRALSRCSSTLTASSSASSLSSVRHPCAPNPSPQLAPNRIQIFPTTNPNTFHAYTSGSARPTVISMDHFCYARASLDEQSFNSNPKPSAVTGRKCANVPPSSIRILANSNGAKAQGSLNTDALVIGQSIGLKNQYKSDSEQLTDAEPDEIEDNVRSFGGNYDDKKSTQSLPPHTTQKFFKFSKSGAEKIRKTREPTEQVTYTPLQSLVIRSCQSVFPIVVTSEPGISNSNNTTNSVLPRQIQTVDGNISPLKGIKIFRRKMTIKHYDHDKYPQMEKLASLNQAYQGAQNVSSGEKDAKDFGSDTNRDINLHQTHSAPNLDYIREISSKYNNSEYYKQLSSSSKSGFQRICVQPQPAKGNSSEEFIAEASIDIDKFRLNKDKGGFPFQILKEGSMQSLNFIDPNCIQISLSSLSRQDAKDAIEKSAKRRRKIQLGTNGGSDDCVSVKIAAGGGFKSNVARYSLLLRQKYHKQQEESIQKHLQQEEILEISKAGIAPISRSDKRTPKSQGYNLSSDDTFSPGVERFNEGSNIKIPLDPIRTHSGLHIKDILDNLYNNGELTEGETPTAAQQRRYIEMGEYDIETCKQNLALSTTPTLNEIDPTKKSSK